MVSHGNTIKLPLITSICFNIFPNVKLSLYIYIFINTFIFCKGTTQIFKTKEKNNKTITIKNKETLANLVPAIPENRFSITLLFFLMGHL